MKMLDWIENSQLKNTRWNVYHLHKNAFNMDKIGVWSLIFLRAL